MRTAILMAAGVLTLVLSTAVSARETNGNQSDVAAVQAATNEFYKALNAMFVGAIEPMDAVWSHEDDITYMGPDGTVDVGYEQTFSNLRKQAEMKLGGEIHHEQIMLTVGKDLAVMECFELGDNLVDDKPVQVSLRVTNIFRKEQGEWKLIGHHTDKLPFLEE